MRIRISNRFFGALRPSPRPAGVLPPRESVPGTPPACCHGSRRPEDNRRPHHHRVNHPHIRCPVGGVGHGRYVSGAGTVPRIARNRRRPATHRKRRGHPRRIARQITGRLPRSRTSLPGWLPTSPRFGGRRSATALPKRCPSVRLCSLAELVTTHSCPPGRGLPPFPNRLEN